MYLTDEALAINCLHVCALAGWRSLMPEALEQTWPRSILCDVWCWKQRAAEHKWNPKTALWLQVFSHNACFAHTMWLPGSCLASFRNTFFPKSVTHKRRRWDMGNSMGLSMLLPGGTRGTHSPTQRTHNLPPAPEAMQLQLCRTVSSPWANSLAHSHGSECCYLRRLPAWTSAAHLTISLPCRHGWSWTCLLAWAWHRSRGLRCIWLWTSHATLHCVIP